MTGDVQADMDLIRDFYSDKGGVNPAGGTVRLAIEPQEDPGESTPE